MDPKDVTHLVIRARAGDLEAFAALVRWTEPRLRAYVAKLVGARPIVDDVLQETFLRLWRGLAWLREPALFQAWSYRIATREAHRALGREWKKEAVRADVSEIDALAAEVVDHAARLDIEACLPQVTPRPRIVVVAHYFEGLSLEEVASATDAPLGTVKSRLASGLVQLRALLGASR